MSWNIKFVNLAHYIAEKWSKDPSTKVGCVLVDPANHAVITTGFNGFARGVEEHPMSDRWTRPTKYKYCEHAERNAIYNAARLGHRTEGCHAYMNWNPAESICTDCARALIQAGVVQVFGAMRNPQGREDITDHGWRYDCHVATEMMEEAGIGLHCVFDTEVPNE